MDDFQIKLSVSRVEDKYCPIDRFRGKIPFESLVNGYSIDIRVVHKPDNLVGKELCVILRIEIRLGRF